MSAFNTHEIADLFFGAAKSETAYGTDIFGGSAPSSGEWCAFRNLEITPLIEHRENPRGTATVSGEPSIPIKVRNDVVWEVPLLGKAGSDLGPIHEALLMMCGLQRTIDAGVDVAYTPYSYNDMAECPSATFAQYLLNEEGDVKKMLARGCRSNFEMVIEMGQAGYIGGTGQALYDDEPTAWSSPPTLPQQYSADKTPMVATSLSLQTEGTTTYPIERLTLASNWNLTALMAGDSTGGGITSEILLHKPRSGSRFGGELVLADGAAALAEVIAYVRSGVLLSLEATLTSGSDTLTLTAPAAQLIGAAKQREGVVKRAVAYALNRAQAGTSSGHDDFEIAYS